MVAVEPSVAVCTRTRSRSGAYPPTVLNDTNSGGCYLSVRRMISAAAKDPSTKLFLLIALISSPT
jgi:hypothetical protein